MNSMNALQINHIRRNYVWAWNTAARSHTHRDVTVTDWHRAHRILKGATAAGIREALDADRLNDDDGLADEAARRGF